MHGKYPSWSAIVFLGLFLAGWETIRVVFDLPRIIMPGIWEIATAMAAEPRFIHHCLITIVEAGIGFVLGNVGAITLSLLLVRWGHLESAVMPYAIALKTTPVIALAPILIVWFGAGITSKVIAAAVVCFFPTLVNLVKGLRAVEAADLREYLDLFRVWGASWYQTLFRLRIPFALPLFFAALKVSSSLALVGAIVGEFIASNAGLGFLIVVYSRRLETPKMFGAVAASALIGVVFFYGVVWTERLLGKRYSSLVGEGEIL